MSEFVENYKFPLYLWAVYLPSKGNVSKDAEVLCCFQAWLCAET